MTQVWDRFTRNRPTTLVLLYLNEHLISLFLCSPGHRTQKSTKCSSQSFPFRFFTSQEKGEIKYKSRRRKEILNEAELII